MADRSFLSVILVLAFAVWGSVLWLLGIELTWDLAKPYTITVTALTAILAGFDKLFWHLPPFRWFIKRPNIRGTWKVEIQSTFVNPVTHERAGPISGYAVVRQTYSQVSLRLLTRDSNSSLIAHELLINSDGVAELLGMYQSEPQIHLRGSESEIHYGAFKIRLSGSPPHTMRGHYWTDRETRGAIIYTDKKKMSAESYEEAEALFL